MWKFAGAELVWDHQAQGGRELSWFVYMLRCGDGSLYTGCTNDLAARLAAHQSGRGAKYTRSHLPVSLAYWEELPDRSAAMRREAAVKRLSRAQKLMLMTDQTPGMPPSGPRGDPEGGSGAE